MRKHLFFLLSICLFYAYACKNATGPKQYGIIALTNGFLIDGNGEESAANITVLIIGDLIQDVDLDTVVDIPDDAHIIDLQGAAILPGFFNTHVHKAYDSKSLKAWARAGVTTVRDLSNLGGYTPEKSYNLRNTLCQDSQNARLIAAGPMLCAPQGYGNYSIYSPSDARQKVNQLIDKGTNLIKIGIEDDLQGKKWPLLSQEEINVIVSTAHERGVPVSAHVSRARHVQMAVQAGVDDLAHMIVDGLSNDLIQDLIEKDIYWVPTMELWKGVGEIHAASWYTNTLSNLKRFAAAGGKIALGTDFEGYIVPFDLGMPMTEIQCLEAAGMSPMEIIVAATKHAAHVCGVEDILGTIEPGKIADILIIESNPLNGLDALQNVKMVIHNGEIIE